MTIFPTATNAAYRGGRSALFILGFAIVATLIPACIHAFLPDGGANSIAGMGLDPDSPHGRRVIALMAWAGVTQLVWGLILLAILVRYRSLVPLALGLLTLERLAHGWHFWGPKGGDHHPPEAYATLLIIPLFAIGFMMSVRASKG